MSELNEEVLLEANHACPIVQLIPYQHQVGGHVCLLTYDEETVCKPLNERERKVYRYLPDQLREFTPQFCGVVKVHFEKCGDDILCFALPSDCSYCKDIKRLKNYLLATKAIPLKNDSHKNERKSEKGKHLLSWNSIDHYSSAKEGIRKRWQDNFSSSKKLDEFIKLECLSRYYKFPCIIDLKMGTRGYGDFGVSKEKRQRKEERIKKSTSGTLGVRLCGMQVYLTSSSEYTFVDKYAGRSYSKDEFKRVLQDFLYNGQTYRTDVIQPLIDKLNTLLKHLQSIEGYRFYCSSLLLMYDGINDQSETSKSASDISGSESVASAFPKVEVRMIDFANARLKEEESNPHIGPDHGYILGVTSLIGIFSELRERLGCEGVNADQPT